MSEWRSVVIEDVTYKKTRNGVPYAEIRYEGGSKPIYAWDINLVPENLQGKQCRVCVEPGKFDRLMAEIEFKSNGGRPGTPKPESDERQVMIVRQSCIKAAAEAVMVLPTMGVTLGADADNNAITEGVGYAICKLAKIFENHVFDGTSQEPTYEPGPEPEPGDDIVPF